MKPKRIICLVMGRSGSHALPNWIASNSHYRYITAAVRKEDFIADFLKPLSDPQVLRTECYDITWPDLKLTTPERQIVYAWRDPFNQFASVLAYAKRHRPSRSRAEQIQIIKEVYIPNHKRVLKNALKQIQLLPADAIFINYNMWITSHRYRKQIANQLHLPSSEKGVTTAWTPSMFDTHRTNPQQYNLLQRWTNYAKDEDFVDLFRDEELLELSNQFWPLPPIFAPKTKIYPLPQNP